MFEATGPELGNGPLPGRRSGDGTGALGRVGVVSLDLDQVLDGQGLGGAVELGHVVENVDRFLIPALTNQVPRALAELEQQEPREEGRQRDRPHRVHEISPSHVVFLPALAGRGVGGARKVGQKSPGRAGRDELADGPPDRQDLQQVLVRAGQELKKDCGIDGHCTQGSMSTRIIGRVLGLGSLQFPPTPKPQNETSTAHETKLLAAPAAVPKTPAINNVKLKASRLPMRSPENK